MEQISNIITIQDGHVRTPYLVLERVGMGADIEKYKGVMGRRIIGETHDAGEEIGIAFTYLICDELKDAEWTDIEEPPKEKPKKRKKKVVEPPVVGQNIDVKL